VFDMLVVLSAEITLREKEPRIIRPAFDAEALKRTGKPIAIAIRINPFPGPFHRDDSSVQQLITLVSERIEQARAAGLAPRELHVDFDCAEAKLGGYLLWLQAIRKAVAPLPVVPTTLPSWLQRPEFTAIARECGGFILQVHSVSAPRRPADVGRLTDPARAREWVERAADIGVPFRVALPTYAYLVAFAPGGQIRGISAEGPSSRWPEDSRVIRWEAQPAEIADLVASWTTRRPETLRGLIWYRMPVAGDTLNWRMSTLERVMHGKAPRRELTVEATSSEAADVILTNRGEADEPLPNRIEASCIGATVIAADALDGYQVDVQLAGENRVIFRRNDAAELIRLPPGARRNIGWIRCDTPTEIRVSIGEAAPPHADVGPAARSSR
jgi:hypothetical protein